MSQSQKTRGVNNRLGLRDWNASVREARRNGVQSRLPGADMRQGPGGSILTHTGPQYVRWVFVIGFDSGVVLCKEGLPYSAGWRVSTSNNDIIRATMPHGYTQEHFTRFVLAGPQPTATEMVCKLVGFVIEPHWRLKLVDPPESAECASCT